MQVSLLSYITTLSFTSSPSICQQQDQWQSLTQTTEELVWGEKT